jgi:hypothetical protein
MAWSALPIPRRFFPARPARQLVATSRGKMQTAAERTIDRSIDLVLTTLAGRPGLYRLVDDIIDRLATSPALYRLVDDIVEYISVQPAVRELVQSQGAHLTDEIIDQSRKHLAQADETVDRAVSSVRGRLHVHRRGPRPTERR